MKFVALISGGKDSFYNILECHRQGHELVALANLHPLDQEQNETDSFMFQTVGHDRIEHYGLCLLVPLYRQPLSGGSTNVQLEYTPTADDEIEDLYTLLARVKEEIPDVEGVSCGAILSHYQRTRVENVCDRIGLTCLAYLWQRDQAELMLEMCSLGLDARLIKCAAVGLNEKHLGKLITEMLPILTKLNQIYDVHVCGEGGEFETFVFDFPLFERRLEICDEKVVAHSSDSSYLTFLTKLVSKEAAEISDPLVGSSETQLLEEDFASVLETVEEAAPIGVPETREVSFPIGPTVTTAPNKLHISNVTSTALDVESQTQDIMTQISSILKSHEASITDIQHITVLVRDMKDFARINAIYASFFADTFLPPSRVCVQTTLPQPYRLQISCIVLNPPVETRQGIHIRSRSFWAPQNIGPYSQAIVETRDTFKTATLSGQIPLVPATMELDSDNSARPAILSLQHLYKVKSLVNVKQLATAVCYVTTTSPQTAAQVWKEYVQEVEHGQNFDDRLIIVQVSGLPRNATIEWSGLAYERIVGMYDEEDDETDAPRMHFSAKELTQGFKTNIVNVNENFNVVKMMTNDIGLVIDFLRSPAIGNSQVTVMTKLLNIHKLVALGLPAEWVPVINVWDSDGVEYGFAITWIT